MATILSTETKLREIITTFTNQRKDVFLSNLSKQLEYLSARLDEQQACKLQAIPVADVVNEVTNRVVENVVRRGLALTKQEVVSTQSMLNPIYIQWDLLLLGTTSSPSHSRHHNSACRQTLGS